MHWFICKLLTYGPDAGHIACTWIDFPPDGWAALYRINWLPLIGGGA